jgi:pyridinium-3,5-biscarboxylic acid mononucleotide sulfurtransferase
MIQEKLQKLQQTLAGLKRVLIAFSGGVDSTFLLKVAADTLGPDNVLACIGISPSLSQYQHQQARQLAAQFGVRLEELPLDELQDPAYLANNSDRCFHCKSRLYKLLTDKAKEQKIQYVLCGSNFDDKSDYRPGHHAAEVFGILSPMMDIGLTKAQIRELSRQMNLPTADLPASPCLASRVAYGMEITEQKLSQVEKAEDYLRSLGFVEFRVRHHGDIARIEVAPKEFAKITPDPIRKQIADHLKTLGFKYITLDLQGFRSGSMNETLNHGKKSIP